MRIGSMVLLLVVLGLFMARLHDPDTLRVLDRLFDPDAKPAEEAAIPPAPAPAPVAAQAKPAAPKANEKTAAKPPEAVESDDGPDDGEKPTDLDPDQRDEARREFPAITDRTLGIQREEMVPYKRMVRWTLNQTTPQMRERAKKGLDYNDFMQSPGRHRGQLVELVLRAKLIRKCPEIEDFPVPPLYEVWGPSADSGSWQYCAVVVNLPEGMPIGRMIDEQVRIVGYFFKVQGYKPGLARPQDPNDLAPMFIGRMVWLKPTEPAAEQGGASWNLAAWGLGALLAVAGIVVAALGFGRRRTSAGVNRPPDPHSQSAAEGWLDAMQSGREAHPLDPEDSPEENGS
jgi:hypothetical protein